MSKTKELSQKRSPKPGLDWTPNSRKTHSQEESTIKLPQFLKSKHLLPVRHEEKRAIQPMLPLLLLERKRDMPPPPSFPPLKHSKSTDLKHKRQQNEREQKFHTTKRKKFKNPGRNKKPRTAKKEKKNKHKDYSGSKKKKTKKQKKTDIQEEEKIRKLTLIDRVRMCSVRVSVLAARIERNKEASNCKSAKLSFRSSSRESGAKREETENSHNCGLLIWYMACVCRAD
jgi:hypothetical protein